MAYIQPIPDLLLIASATRAMDETLNNWAWRKATGDETIREYLKPNLSQAIKETVKIGCFNNSWRIHTAGHSGPDRWLGQVRLKVHDLEDHHKIHLISLGPHDVSGVPRMSGNVALTAAILKGNVNGASIAIFNGIFNNVSPWYLNNLEYNVIVSVDHTLGYVPEVECDYWYDVGDIIDKHLGKEIVEYQYSIISNPGQKVTFNCPISHLVFWFDSYDDRLEELTLILDHDHVFGPFDNKYFNDDTNALQLNLYVMRFGEDNVFDEYTPWTKTLNFSRITNVEIRFKATGSNKLHCLASNINVLTRFKQENGGPGLMMIH